MHRYIEKEGDWEGMGVKGSEQPILLCDIEKRFVRGPLNTVVLLLNDQRYRDRRASLHIPGCRRGINAG